MPETTPLIKAALNLRVGVGFDVYERRQWNIMMKSFLQYWTNVLEIFSKLEKLPQNCKRILAGKKLWSKK